MKTCSDHKKEEPLGRSASREPDQAGSDDKEVRQQIAVRAYERYQERGCIDGHDLEDWLEAERTIIDGEATTGRRVV